MVIKELDYVHGNTAINPKKKSSERDRKKYEELKRSKQNRNRRLLEERKKLRSALLQIAAVILIIGTIIIARDGKVYSIQNEVSDIKSEIKKVTADNDAIKVDMFKFSSLDNIQKTSEEKLGMIVSTKDDLVEIDMSGNYFQELNDKEAETANVQVKGLFSKIMDALKL